MMMHVCILLWDNGKCILKTQFFLPLLPARFLLGIPTDDDQPKPGNTPDNKPASLPDNHPSLPETPGRGRGRIRDPDPGHGPGHGRPRRGRTPEGEARRYRGPEEDEEEEEEEEELEDRLHRLLKKWESDISRLREDLRRELLNL
ncbi:E4 early protein [Bos taurus papillomavirus 38]|nr:E4 early protein [Bos taurus papillomavirus 38]